MSFGLQVGVLADLREFDEEGFQHQLEQFAIVNKVLSANGLREHVEPQELEYPAYLHNESGFGYRQLHELRRVAARLALGRFVFTDPMADATKDPIFDEYFSRFENGEALKFQHLIVHSDAEGYYVPVDFGRVLFAADLPLAGRWLGSTPRLQVECLELAGLIATLATPIEQPTTIFGRLSKRWKQIAQPPPFNVARQVCDRMLAACEASMVAKAAICFCG